MPTLEAKCPFCGSEKTRPAHSRGIFDDILESFGVFPFRCGECRRRFRFRLWKLRDFFYAKCPRCYRLDLTTWELKYYRPATRIRLKLSFGAQPLRCDPCRCNFASFRPRKERWRKSTFVNPALAREQKPLSAPDDPDQADNQPHLSEKR